MLDWVATKTFDGSSTSMMDLYQLNKTNSSNQILILKLKLLLKSRATTDRT